jgi:glucose/arabinose dehydrogenase
MYAGGSIMIKKNIYTIVLMFVFTFFVVSCSPIQDSTDSDMNSTSGLSPSEKEPETLAESATEENDFSGQATNDTSSVLDLEGLGEMENSFNVINAFPDLSFERPLAFQTPGDDSGRIFIVEQNGRIFVINDTSTDEAVLFMDISERVDDSGNEMGLLGLAFHPGFNENNQFFLNYTTSSQTIISRFSTDKNNPDRGDPESEVRILTYEQPYSNHNGGHILFGDHDGYLYIAAGDGGGAGDPQGNGQNRLTLLGNILRIDVDSTDPGLNYAIPQDNPFKGNNEGFREEIFAYGLRNPWRFSFDPETERLWAADVGQNQTEEIDIIYSGRNYGWNIMEGSQCYQPPSGCDTEGLELPIYEYTHQLGRSITGGYVYRGEKLEILQGVYIYADFITGYIWGLVLDEGGAVRNYTLAESGLNISSFGIDQDQELYFTAFDGNIYRLSLP